MGEQKPVREPRLNEPTYHPVFHPEPPEIKEYIYIYGYVFMWGSGAFVSLFFGFKYFKMSFNAASVFEALISIH